MRWDGLVEVALMTTSAGPVTDDVFVSLSHADGSSHMVPLNDDDTLPRLQQLPGFDNEAFIEAMGCAEEGVSVLWRRAPID